MRSILRTLVFAAGICLLANDVVRLLVPAVWQCIVVVQTPDKEQEEDNPVPPFSILEEEVKHWYHEPHLLVFQRNEATGFRNRCGHLITDDAVRHLAFIPIFSPPPNLG